MAVERSNGARKIEGLAVGTCVLRDIIGDAAVSVAWRTSRTGKGEGKMDGGRGGWYDVRHE